MHIERKKAILMLIIFYTLINITITSKMQFLKCLDKNFVKYVLSNKFKL